MKNAFYTCPYCKQEYENPVDLAHCILTCEEKERLAKEEAEAKAKAKKLTEEKNMRYKEIEKKEEELSELIKKYIEDYGAFRFSKSDDYPLGYLFNKLFF